MLRGNANYRTQLGTSILRDSYCPERASKKLKNEELLITNMAGTRLHLEITQIPLWRAPGNHVGVKQLVDDFAKYVYLPRVKNAQVILDAIQDGVARLGR